MLIPEDAALTFATSVAKPAPQAEIEYRVMVLSFMESLEQAEDNAKMPVKDAFCHDRVPEEEEDKKENGVLALGGALGST